MILFVILGAIAVAIVVSVLVSRSRHPRADDIRPAPDFRLLAPSRAARASHLRPAPPPSFDNALPTKPPEPERLK